MQEFSGGKLKQKGFFHSVGHGLRNAFFNEDLWNEPNLGWIHLAGQYL